MRWWLQNGLAGFFLLSLLWGVVCIAYDVAIMWLYGVKDTISWQTQQAAMKNPIVALAVGLPVGFLGVHFFCSRTLPLFDRGQPWINNAIGVAIGALVAFFYWRQG